MRKKKSEIDVAQLAWRKCVGLYFRAQFVIK